MIKLLASVICVIFSCASSAVSFSKGRIKVGKEVLTVEFAITDMQRQQGLMNRKTLAKGQGMLFVFESEKQRTFWMKNTLIPLSIGFFDKKGRLVGIQKMKPAKSVMQKDTPIYRSHRPAKFALEVPLGWFAVKKIKLGAQLTILEGQVPGLK